GKFSGGHLRGDEGVEFPFVGAASGGERGGDWWCGADDIEVGEGGDDDARGEGGEEGGQAAAAGGDAVGVGVLDPFDQAFEAEASQVVGGLVGGVVGGPAAGHVLTQA